MLLLFYVIMDRQVRVSFSGVRNNDCNDSSLLGFTWAIASAMLVPHYPSSLVSLVFTFLSTAAELQFLSSSFRFYSFFLLVCQVVLCKYLLWRKIIVIRLIQKTSHDQCHIIHTNSASWLIFNFQVREAFKYCICCWRRSRRGSYWVRGQGNELKTSPNEVRGSDFPNTKKTFLFPPLVLPPPWFLSLKRFYTLVIFNNYSSSLNGLWISSPWGRRPNGLLTQNPWGREE